MIISLILYKQINNIGHQIHLGVKVNDRRLLKTVETTQMTTHKTQKELARNTE